MRKIAEEMSRNTHEENKWCTVYDVFSYGEREESVAARKRTINLLSGGPCTPIIQWGNYPRDPTKTLQ